VDQSVAGFGSGVVDRSILALPKTRPGRFGSMPGHFPAKNDALLATGGGKRKRMARVLIWSGQAASIASIAIAMKISSHDSLKATGLIQIFDGVVAALNISICIGHPIWAMVFMAASVWCVMFGARNLAS
jgi:hypothetical protein